MATLTYQDLLDENEALRRENQQLRRRVAELEAQVNKLTRLLEQATRGGKRQAAPFSKGGPKANPKKPGRKSGPAYGRKGHRPPPAREPDEIVDVPLPGACDCGSHDIEDDHVDQQYQLEIPRRPTLRRFDVHVGVCRRCGRRIRGRHPLQTSDAVGAAASQLGPDTQAMIALLKDKYGLSYGDICGVLEEGFDIPLTRGGAAQVVLRAAQRAEPVYDGLKQTVAHSDVVYPDETGWKVGGALQWMWVFVTGLATAYVIRPSRGRDVPAEVLGADYDGMMVHDGWSVYDGFDKALHQQCLAHLLRRANDLVERGSPGAARFPRKVKRLLQDALDLRDRRDAGQISPHGLATARGRLEKRLDRLLKCRLSHEANRRFQAHLARHREEILLFLYESSLEATNWPAEQAIRPAVVNRKVFGGNRTPAGAHAQEVLGSVFATCAQHARDALSFLSDLIRLPAEERSARAPELLPVRNG